MKRTILPLCGALLCMIAPLMAEVRVQGDGSEVKFTTADYEALFVKANPKSGVSYAWTLATLRYKDRDLIIDSGANGAAMQLKSDQPLPEGGFVGSRHGGEEIRRAVIVVDGKEYPPDQPLDTSGKEVAMVKESVIAAYEHTSRVGLNNEGLSEEATFKVIADASHVIVFYPFMHCLGKVFTNWETGSDDGVLSAGEFTSDDAFTNLGRLKWIGVYSMDEGYGGVISFAENYEGRNATLHRFWNRPRDNKVYFWPKAPLEGEVRFACRVAGFEATADDWSQKAAALERQLTSAAAAR